MKRRALKVFGCIIAGAIFNVVTAWTLVILVDVTAPTRLVGSAIENQPWGGGTDNWQARR